MRCYHFLENDIDSNQSEDMKGLFCVLLGMDMYSCLGYKFDNMTLLSPVSQCMLL